MKFTIYILILATIALSFSTPALADSAVTAADLVDQRKLDEAIAYITAETAKDPTYAELYYWLGRAHIEKESWREAETALNKALEIKKKLDEAKAYLALVYINTQRFPEAKKILEEGAAKSKTQKGRFLNHLGHYYLAQKDFSQADINFRKAQIEEPENLEYIRDLADVNYENGVYAVAVLGYKDVLAKDSTDAVTWYKVARAYYMQRQFNESSAAVGKAIGLDSAYAQAYKLYADIFMISGLSKVSAQAQLDPNQTNGNGFTDFFKNAIWAYERYLKNGGAETDEVNYRLGQAYYQVGAYDAAIEKLRRAIEQGTDKSIAYDFTAKSLFRLKRYDEASAAYQAYEMKITKGDPNFQWGPEYYDFFKERALTYDQLYYDNKKEGVIDSSFLERAIPNFVQAIKLNEKEPFMWNRLALAYYNLGRYDDAISWLQKRLDLDSTHISSLQYMAFSYLKKNDPTTAAGYLEKMHTLNPKSEFVLETLSTHYLTRDREKARKFLNDWAEVNPNNYKPFKWLGYLAISAKPAQKEAAVKHLEKALQLMDANGVDKCKEIDVIVWLAQANSFFEDTKHEEETLKWVKRGLVCDPKNETLVALRQNLE